MFKGCLFCKKFLFYKNYCDECWKNIPVKFHYFYGESIKIYGSCVYNDITSQPILDLKYNNNPFIAKAIAQFIYEQVKIPWDFDYLVPIPIRWYKQIHRGYNQSYLIAQELSKIIKIPVKNLLQKLDHKNQTNSQREHRVQSTKFTVNEIPPGKKILIIDDVITTGSTMLSAYNVLKNYYEVEGLVFNYSKKFVSNFQWNNNNFIIK